MFQINTGPAPVDYSVKRGRTAFWEDLFNEMRSGDWFLVSTVVFGRVSQAASRYLKGRYSMRRSTKEDTKVRGKMMYVFIKK